jgi:hypothetical protein
MSDAIFTRHSATRVAFERYLAIIGQAEGDPLGDHERLSLRNLEWICTEAVERGEGLPLDKLSRWLGFVQGCLASRTLIDVDEERDFTRPLFHQAYQAEGVEVPKVFERN